MTGADMGTCENCGNEYDKAFQVVMKGETHTFDSFEFAIHALAPTCSHCGTRIVGLGLESDGISGILLLAAAALFAAYDRELPRIGRDPSVDQAFMRHMSTHHKQGILLASIAAERAGDPHLRAVSKLMVGKLVR
jgi:hypothetical protein